MSEVDVLLHPCNTTKAVPVFLCMIDVQPVNMKLMTPIVVLTTYDTHFPSVPPTVERKVKREKPAMTSGHASSASQACTLATCLAAWPE